MKKSAKLLDKESFCHSSALVDIPKEILAEIDLDLQNVFRESLEKSIINYFYEVFSSAKWRGNQDHETAKVKVKPLVDGVIDKILEKQK